MNEVFAVGHDYGNADVCSRVVGNGVKTLRRIPSVFADGSWQKVVSLAHGTGKTVQDLMKPEHYILEYDYQTPEGVRHINKAYGQKVFDDGSHPLSTRGDSSRYWANNYNVEALMVATATQISLLQEYGVYVVTGMPIASYDPETANQVQQGLLGTHHFTFNGVERTMHVIKARCIMEGAGALIAYGSAAEEEQGVIDIGGHTTDLFAARGQKPQASRCKGFQGGVSGAVDRFQSAFKEAYGRDINSEKCQALFLQHITTGRYEEVRDKNRQVISVAHLKELIETALRETGQDIATQVAKAWGDAVYDMARILIVGGGAHYFVKDLQARFSACQIVREPEFANVEGYSRLAEGLMYRDRMNVVRSA